MPNRMLLLLLALCLSSLAFGQRSNIYLFDVVLDEKGQIAGFTNPRFLTEFNAQGSNTGPAFFSPDEIYVSVKLPAGTQTDLYRLDLKNRTKRQVTDTPESEMAPAPMPDFYNFSAIRREKDGAANTLRLWQFPIDQLTNGKPLFKYLTGVESYYWLNSREIVIFKGGQTGEPSTLLIMDTFSDKVETIATDVGSNFIRIPTTGNLAFVKKSRYDDWKLMEKNLYRIRDEPRTIIEMLPNAELFTVMPDGTFLMAKGSKLYKYNQKTADDNWKEAADLRFYEINNILGLVIGPERPLSPEEVKTGRARRSIPIAIVAE